MRGICFSVWILEACQAAVVVAGDEQTQKQTKFGNVSWEAPSSAIQSRHVTAQIRIDAFNGVGLFLTGSHIMAGVQLAIAINQLAVSWKTIAIKLMNLWRQRKDRIYQRLHFLNGALFQHVPGKDAPRFALGYGGNIEPVRSVLFVFFSPVFLFLRARLALQKV